MRLGRTRKLNGGRLTAGQLVLVATLCALFLAAPGLIAAFQAPGDDSILAMPVGWFHALFVVPCGLAIIVMVLARRLKRLRP